jgi:AcrR family transcriptional regulator
MTETGDPTVSRQREVGAASRLQTQRRLLQAAADEFAQHGYAATTVSRIAKRAGVTVQTLYLAWGSKRALLRGYLEAELAGTAGAPGEIGDRLAGRSPGELMAGLARIVAEVADRSALGWKLYRDAAATDPQIADDWSQLQALRRTTFQSAIDLVPPSALRPGLSPASAADTAWTIASPESYDLLVRRAGYSPDEFERWMAATLTAALLAAP